MRLRRISLVLVLLVSTSAISIMAAGSKRAMTVNGKTMDLKFAHARTKPNPFDKTKTDVFLIFTDKELPAGALFDEFELMSLADKGTSGVTAQVTAEKKAVSGTLFSPGFKKMKQFSSTGNQAVTITSWTKDRIAGSVSVPASDFFDEKFQYDVSFDMPIESKPAAKPLPGTPLPAGGGEPGKAYEAYRKAMSKGDLPAIRKVVIPEMAKQTESPDFKQMLPMVQAMQPKKIRITGGSVDGNDATLLVDSLDEKNTRATVAMRRDSGQWKVAKESWKTTLD